jgi:hypothetical protein
MGRVNDKSKTRGIEGILRECEYMAALIGDLLNISIDYSPSNQVVAIHGNRNACERLLLIFSTMPFVTPQSAVT